MLKHFLFLLIILSGLHSAIAQAPGYMGKRITIGADLHSFLAFVGPTANNRGSNRFYDGSNESDFSVGVNWRVGGSVGYVLSRNTQLLLFGDYLKTGVAHEAYLYTNNGFGGSNTDYFTVFHQMTGLTGGVGMRKYSLSKGALAPMGRYWGLSLLATQLRANVTKTGEVSANPSVIGKKLGLDGAKVMNLSLGYEIGYSYIISDNLQFNIGVKTILLLTGQIARRVDPDLSGQDTEADNKLLFKKAALSRYAPHGRFNINLGLSYLIPN